MPRTGRHRVKVVLSNAAAASLHDPCANKSGLTVSSLPPARHIRVSRASSGTVVSSTLRVVRPVLRHDPRMLAICGDPKLAYSYSGTTGRKLPPSTVPDRSPAPLPLRLYCARSTGFGTSRSADCASPSEISLMFRVASYFLKLINQDAFRPVVSITSRPPRSGSK
jgi:hypothetical protein